MFLLNMVGAVNAESKVMLLFNVPNALSDQVYAYLRENALFGEEPTLSRGKEYTEYNIQVDAADVAKPVALVRYTLAKLGAQSINTVPITSSIPGLKAVRGRG
jgi:ATP phosphoribosyltransferase